MMDGQKRRVNVVSERPRNDHRLRRSVSRVYAANGDSFVQPGLFLFDQLISRHRDLEGRRRNLLSHPTVSLPALLDVMGMSEPGPGIGIPAIHQDADRSLAFGESGDRSLGNAEMIAAVLILSLAVPPDPGTRLIDSPDSFSAHRNDDRVAGVHPPEA